MRWAVRIGMAGAAVACQAWAQTPQPQDPAQTVRELTQRNDYWLCEHSKGAADGHRRWCKVAPRAAHCRAWTAHCSGLALPTETTLAGTPQAKSLQTGDTDGAGRHKSTRGAQDRDDTSDLPSLPWLRDILVGAVLALVAWLAWKVWRQWRSQPAAQDDMEPTLLASDIQVVGLDDPRTLPEVEVALARARALAATQPGLALAWLYAASLRHLHDDGALRWHPALGNRAALRTLHRDHPLRGPLREVIAGLEQWRFGGRTPDAPQVDRCLRLVSPILRAGTAAVLALAVAACGPTGDTTVAGRALTWDLLREQGWEISGHRLSLRDIDADSPTVWVDAEVSTVMPSMLAELRDAACRRGQVVLFASHGQPLAPLHGAVIDLAAPATHGGDFGPMPPTRAPADRRVVLPLRLAVSDAPAMTAALRAELGELIADLVATPPKAPADEPPAACAIQREPQPLLWLDDQPAALRWRAPGGGSLVVVADNDLLANAAMTVPENARALVSLARDTAPKRAIALLVAQGAPPAQDASDALAAAGLLPFLGQGLLVLLVAAWMYATRFGAPRSQQADQRRAFTDHVAALAELMRVRAATRWPAAQVCALALERLQRRLGPTDLATLAERAAAGLADGDPRATLRLLQQADALRADPNGADHPADLRTARAMDSLVAELDRKLPATVAPLRRTKGTP